MLCLPLKDIYNASSLGRRWETIIIGSECGPTHGEQWWENSHLH